MTLANLGLSAEVSAILTRLGVPQAKLSGGTLAVRSPVNGEQLARLA